MYVVIASNKRIIDRCPHICDTENQVNTIMHTLMAQGIINHKPEIIRSFSAKHNVKIEDYTDLVDNELVDTFFDELAARDDFETRTTSMRILLSEDKDDAYEVEYLPSLYFPVPRLRQNNRQLEG